MDKQQRIQDCLDEIGVVGTSKETTTRDLLGQLYDKKPQDTLDEAFFADLLVQIKQKHRRSKQWIFSRIQRYYWVMVSVPLVLLIFVWIWSFWIKQDTLIDPDTQWMIRTINYWPLDTWLTEHDAISALIYEFEELWSYQNIDSLPIKTIRTEKNDTWRLVVFIVEGSWRKTILSAECYHVSEERNITKLWTFEA